jgi:hypothetical protein
VRRAATAFAITLALAGTASAQIPGTPTSNRGAFALDAMVAPTTGFGFGYYVTDGLSLRPWVGLGYDGYGFSASLGAQVRYEFGAGSTVAPFLSASALYSHTPSAAIVEPGTGGASRQMAYQGDGAQFGAGAGLRFQLSRSFSLFTEGRVLYATYPINSIDQGWSSFDMGDRTRGELVFGLTYLMH